MKTHGSFLDTLGHFKNYLGKNVAVKAIGFISIPVLTRLLTPDEYGIYSIFISYLTIFTVISVLNLHSSVSRYYFEKTNDFKQFFGTSVILCMVLWFFFGMGVYLFRSRLSTLLNLPNETIIYFFPLVLFTLFSSFFIQIFQPQNESKKIATRQIFEIYSKFGISIVFILSLSSSKFMGLIYGHTLVGFLFFLFYLKDISRYFQLAFNKNHVKYIFSYSLPLLPYSLSGIILTQIDRVMIGGMLDTTKAGLYSFAYNIGMLLFVVVSSFSEAWMPKYFDLMSQRKYEQLDRELLIMYKTILIFALGLVLFAKELGHLLATDSYFQSLSIIPIIVAGYVFQAIFTFYGRNIGYSKKTYYSAVILLLAGILNIMLNAYTIPKFGYESAAINTVVSYAFLALESWIVSKFIIRIHSFPLKLLFPPLLVLIIFAGIHYYLDSFQLPVWFLIILKIFLLIGFGVAMLFKSLRMILSSRR